MIFRCLLTTFRASISTLREKEADKSALWSSAWIQTNGIVLYRRRHLSTSTDDIAYPQSAEAGEQISLFYGFVFHRSSNQCPHLFNGHIRPLALRQTDFIRIVDLRKRIDFYNFRSHGCIQSSVQNAVIGV